MKLYIKNMVCNRCKMVVRTEMENAGLQVLSVELGEVEIPGSLSESEKNAIRIRLQAFGFDLINDKKSRIIEKIKNEIVELVHYTRESPKLNLSDHLSQKLHQDYSSLSNLFSDVEGTTIEHYVISQKIEKVKELLVYDELSLSQIADQMNYSSVAHLSNQFKKVTGFSPSHFRKLKDKKRNPLEEL